MTEIINNVKGRQIYKSRQGGRKGGVMEIHEAVKVISDTAAEIALAKAKTEIERLREALQSLYDWHRLRDTSQDAEYRLAVRGAEEALRAARAAERGE